MGAEGGQQVDVGAGDAAVQDVADDRDPAAVEVLAESGIGPDQPAAHREGVQECLGGVLVGAVAGVHDRAVDPAGGGEAVRGAGGAVPDDDGVGAHRLQGQGRVLERLALGDGGALGGEVDDVGGQALGGCLEGDAGTRRVLEEEVDDGTAAQGRELLDRPVRDPGHLLGGVEDQDGVVAGEVGGRDEVALHLGVLRVAGGFRHAGVRKPPYGSGPYGEGSYCSTAGAACSTPSSTASRPSSSASWTLTVSRSDVGRFLPT